MALWFSASAVVPALVAEFHLSGFAQAALTSGVQAGFVAGLPRQRVLRAARPRRSAADSSPPLRAARRASPTRCCSSSTRRRWRCPLLRVVTGIAMAGVYPVGMKLASTWAKGDMGLMVGMLVGALTLGSALPHLVQRVGRRATGGCRWRSRPCRRSPPPR